MNDKKLHRRMVSKTQKLNPKHYNGGGCQEYWSKRPHNKGGSDGTGKYQKQRTVKTERRAGKLATTRENDVPTETKG